MYLALDELKDKCRKLLRLFYCGKMKVEEIAQLLGYSSAKSAGIVKNRCRGYWFKKSLDIYEKLKKNEQ